jgi:hypothetical protein
VNDLSDVIATDRIGISCADSWKKPHRYASDEKHRKGYEQNILCLE